MSKKYSLERATGFKSIISDLITELVNLEYTSAMDIKSKLIKEKKEELDLFKGMYQAEMDIYHGVIEREARKFLISDDGFTYFKNPEWIPQGDVI